MKMRLRSPGPEPRLARASSIRPTLPATPVSTSVQPSSFSRRSTFMKFDKRKASTLYTPGAKFCGAATLQCPLSRIVVFAVGIPPLLLLDPGIDVDVLGYLEGFQTLAAEFAADAAALLAAEWGCIVVGEGIVDPDGPGPELPHALEHLLEV